MRVSAAPSSQEGDECSFLPSSTFPPGQCRGDRWCLASRGFQDRGRGSPTVVGSPVAGCRVCREWHLRGGFSTLLSASDHCAPLTCEHITAQCLDSHCQAGHRGVECSKTLPFPPLSGALSSKCDRPGAENGWDVGWGGRRRHPCGGGLSGVPEKGGITETKGLRGGTDSSGTRVGWREKPFPPVACIASRG